MEPAASQGKCSDIVCHGTSPSYGRTYAADDRTSPLTNTGTAPAARTSARRMLAGEIPPGTRANVVLRSDR